jgi:hypothetical protein
MQKSTASTEKDAAQSHIPFAALPSQNVVDFRANRYVKMMRVIYCSCALGGWLKVIFQFETENGTVKRALVEIVLVLCVIGTSQ